MKSVITLLFVLLAFSSCKKEGNKTSSDEAKQQLLVNKKWMQVDQSSKDSTGAMHTGYYQDDPPEFRDDYYLFSNDKTFILHDNILRFNSGNPDILQSGTWVLQDSKIIMTLDQPGIQLPFKILEISENSMKVEIAGPNWTIWSTFNTIP